MFTQYNPYTTTGRPSNRHLNVNYSALNKSDGTRECFISRHPHGTLLQFDYESYHIRLIAKMVGYEFPKGETGHQHLANLYGCDYETKKKITFTYLYGGLDDNVEEYHSFKRLMSILRNYTNRSSFRENLRHSYIKEKFLLVELKVVTNKRYLIICYNHWRLKSII